MTYGGRFCPPFFSLICIQPIRCCKRLEDSLKGAIAICGNDRMLRARRPARAHAFVLVRMTAC
ncbi:hypothetical protein B4123_1921 [Bacillus paralicheniformis]|nr:hypothetical protein B4123_1921 [Bacillus paralicheniformis]